MVLQDQWTAKIVLIFEDQSDAILADQDGKLGITAKMGHLKKYTWLSKTLNLSILLS